MMASAVGVVRRSAASIALAATLLTAPALSPAQDGSKSAALAELSLEQLMNVEVTSVSKREEPLLHAPSAIFVITQEDIRRAGFTSIPEALRMVPGVQVARIDGNKWAITARGFDAQFSNKLLVLIDGRTVYNPLFSGVYWDVQDMVLEDVDHIEVIRGPGATLWGANAVNGVINIISKPANETQGGLATAGGGTEEHAFTSLRYGGQLGRDAHYRIFARYWDRGPLFDRDDNANSDGSDLLHGGFRLDWTASPKSAFTVQGDLYDGGVGQSLRTPLLTPPFHVEQSNTRAALSGGNVLGRWRYTVSEQSDVVLQMYYDRTDRDTPVLREMVNVGDIDLQHHVRLGSAHNLVWGFGYRVVGDDVLSHHTVSFDPDHRISQVGNVFVQDEMTLLPDRLRFTLGSKFEYNDFTGFEVEPSARLLWVPAERQALWLAVSRAVRTPSRRDRALHVDVAAFPTAQGLPALLTRNGNPRAGSEELLAYELGYRVRPIERLSLDITGFYNVYDDLQSVEPAGTRMVSVPPPPHLVIAKQYDNKAHGETYGVETATTWQVCDWWRLNAASTWLQMQIGPDASSHDTTVANVNHTSPQHQFSLRSYVDLPHGVEFDTGLYYVDNLAAEHVPSYLRFDTRFGWRPTEWLELSLALQNLNNAHHLEFGNVGISFEPTEVERSVYGKLTVRF